MMSTTPIKCKVDGFLILWVLFIILFLSDVFEVGLAKLRIEGEPNCPEPRFIGIRNSFKLEIRPIFFFVFAFHYLYICLLREDI